jgi:AbrB family looped-hinge helix DNA binding protein
MGVVTLSSKYHIVIPQDVREKMNLKLGQKVIVIEKNGAVHLIPEKPINELRGFVKGVTTDKLRHEEDIVFDSHRLIRLDRIFWRRPTGR